MGFKELKEKLLGSFSRKGQGEFSRRPDGGTSFYRPTRRRDPAENAETREEQADPSLTYVHTGFTGMTPPTNGYETGYGTSGVYAAQGGYDPAQAYGYAQAAQAEAWAPQTVFGQPGAFGTAPRGAFDRSQPNPAYQTAPRPERGWFSRREEPRQQNNISYMPGFSPDAGATFTHVEHIMPLTGLKSCYEAIECMKNGETLIVTLDAIANDGESMRCQDMLAGAAFTLGCTVRMLQGARLVLIAPEGVKILPEEGMQAPVAPPVYAPAPDRTAGRRERRSGANAAEWNAARNGERENYNPYTGTMPAAAGAYGSFGGYGT